MKILLPLLLITLCGCQSQAPVTTLPAPSPFTPVATPPPTPPAARPPIIDQRSRQQQQWIEALIEQNDALTTKLAVQQAAHAAAPLPPVTQTSPVPLPQAAAVAPVASPVTQSLTPNAEGVIDLTVLDSNSNPDEPLNPFAVRTAPGGKFREVSLVVGGIILGSTPCAVVNGRLLQVGDRIESFEVERIETGALVIRLDAHRLRLPVSAEPTRVKLPL